MSLREKLEAAILNDAPLSRSMDLLLRSLTPIQRTGMLLRQMQPRVKVEAHVVSFGNITAGGTGKTPAVIERAAQAVAKGHRVALVTRGYGSEKTPEPFIPAAHSTLAEQARAMGDEAALLKLRVPEVLAIKSANRVLGAQAAIQRKCNFIILDDGFQSVRLERDEDIVLLDAARPFGNGCLLPRGTLRECPAALRRASEVWLTRCDHAQNLEATIALVEKHHGKPPTRLTVHTPLALWRLTDAEWMPLEFLKGKRVIVACGIAHPRQFEGTVQNLDATVERLIAFRDHHQYADCDLPAAGLVLVTEKDAVKLPNARENVYALAMELRDWRP